MNNKPNAQTKLIEKHLKNGKSITPIEALNLFGCLRLAARIADLRKSGMHIVTSYTERDGKRWATYRMKEAV